MRILKNLRKFLMCLALICLCPSFAFGIQVDISEEKCADYDCCAGWDIPAGAFCPYELSSGYDICHPGYYCLGGYEELAVQTPCPYGGTSESGAKSVTECYKMNGNTKVYYDAAIGAYLSAATCPSGYTTVNESDAIYVSNTGSCSAGHTQLGGDIELKNCYTSQNAPMCTYYAENYTAVYNCNGGSGDTSESVTYGDTFTPRTNVCTRSGYEFDGWTIDGATVDSSFAWSYLSDKTLTAKWNLICADEQIKVDDTCVAPEFSIETIDMAAGTTFSFSMSAKGTFYLDCDNDESVRKITKTDTTNTTYSCEYTNGGTHTIKMYGQATGYSSNSAAISFSGNKNIKTVDGSLSAIFGGSGNYMFSSTFYNCTSLTGIPETLFAGVTGSAKWMFAGTFDGCTSLTSIPENLFAGVSGSAEYMFADTFWDCTSLTSIPENLFAGVSGSATWLFYETFSGCTGLRGYIPYNTFPSSDVLSASTMVNTFNNTALDTTCPAGTTQYITGFESAWNGKVSCVISCPDGQKVVNGECVDKEFKITTTDTSDFSFEISAAGTYYLDCGNGDGVRTINKTNTNSETITCTNRISTTIGLSGDATEYDTSSWSGAAAISFSGNTKIKSVAGSLGAIFSGSADYMFNHTFADCTSLTSIPENLFAGISGGANYMFYNTFRGCTSLTGIPEKLFAGISGSAEMMFFYTFSYCTSLTGIPENLFSGVSGSAEWMFYGTFSGCTSLTSIPEKLFAGVSGSASEMFRSTFDGCTSLTSIPENLFAGISGSAWGMFNNTFGDCKSLTSVPENLFAGVNGSATAMFYYTFGGCTSLTTIPENLFAGVSGSEGSMFYGTFSGCTSLTSIPENLFAGVSGSSYDMFAYTFSGCNGLRGYIPYNTFPDSNILDVSTMYDTFANTSLDEVCPSGTYQYITGFESAWDGHVSCAPCPNGVCYTATQCSGDAGVGEKRCYYDGLTNDYTKCDDTCVYTSCNDGSTLLNGACVKFEPEFTITTTSTTSSFSFQISAAGSYIISWGDGNIEQISKSDVTLATYSHIYNTAGKYEINISGQATGYNTDVNTPSVSFSQNKNIAKISGSLGAIFGTLSNGDNPRFRETFFACTNMSGPIPADLFTGITGNPTKRMFTGLFSDCSSLSGEIPADLFSGLTGAVTEYMFNNTFYNCKKLTGGIPSGLFRVTGTPQIYMFTQTFRGCTGLTGTIGDGLFAGIKGAPAKAMFQDTFSQILPRDGGTDMNLTGSIPANLFAGISGAPASMMFFNTFYGCSKLSGTIPGDLFKGIKGQLNGTQAFQYTFEKCASLTGYIPSELFAGVTYSGTYPTGGCGDMCDIFNAATGLATSCAPYGLTEYKTVFKPDWSGKVSCFKPEFSITTVNMAANTSYKFTLGAAGNFMIDWGDGSAIQTINKTDTSVILVSHTYASAGVRTIGISGQATGYYTADEGRRAAVGFSWGDNVNATANHYTAKISGSLGAIFGTLPDGTQPRFNYTFYQSPNLTGTIPENLFSGIQGQPISYMFDGTFFKTGLTGQIPGGLFKDIVGKPVTFLFTSTFSDNYNLVSTIPSELFSGIQGAPAPLMFYQTFYKSSKLNGEIPADLFAKIKGAPAKQMFRQTFAGCSGLTGSIPENLFSGIEGAPAQEMFNQTFSGCTGLTGNVPVELFGRINNTNYQSGPMANVFYDSGIKTTCPDGMIQYHTGFEIDFSDRKACWKPDFTVKANITSANTSFMFRLPSKGKYLVDWGDGTPAQIIDKASTGDEQISHTYTMTGVYHISISGGETEWTPEFTVTADIPSANTNFIFSLSATGRYLIDWGDGTPDQIIEKTSTWYDQISHTYTKAGVYRIGISGDATEYMPPEVYNGPHFSAISFSAEAVETNNACSYITDINGSLGAIFPTLSDGSQPIFRAAFKGCSKLEGDIPTDLFKGVSGNPVNFMFQEVFSGCTNLTGPIPSDLFADISGTAADHLFYGLFDGCTGLMGEIPENLFKNISGGSEGASFSNVFRGCSKLTGSIPDKLFANLDSKPGNRVFSGTFDGCSGLTGSIPADLFASVTGAPEEFAFYMTFANCSGLTGEIPGDLFKTIKTDTPQPYMFFGTFQNCSGLTGSIPADLFSGIKGAPAEGMFNDTFDGCYRLTGSIPADLFAGIKGTPARRMFEGTFKGDTGLTGTIPATLFKGISGAAAPRMFEDTFRGCTGLTGYIPAELFGNITDFNHMSMPTTFYGASSILTSCPAGMYQHILGVEKDWGTLYNDDPNLDDDNRYTDSTYVGEEEFKKVVCMACPTGTTSLAGSVGKESCNMKTKILHIKDAAIHLTPNKPASIPVMAFRVDGTTYYGGLSDTEKTLNDETETKYNVLYNGKHYYLYDATVQ